MSSMIFAVAIAASVAASVASAQTNLDGADGAGQAAAVIAGDDTADYSFGSATQDLVIQASACHPRAKRRLRRDHAALNSGHRRPGSR